MIQQAKIQEALALFNDLLKQYPEEEELLYLGSVLHFKLNEHALANDYIHQADRVAFKKNQWQMSKVLTQLETSAHSSYERSLIAIQQLNDVINKFFFLQQPLKQTRYQHSKEAVDELVMLLKMLPKSNVKFLFIEKIHCIVTYMNDIFWIKIHQDYFYTMIPWLRILAYIANFKEKETFNTLGSIYNLILHLHIYTGTKRKVLLLKALTLLDTMVEKYSAVQEILPYQQKNSSTTMIHIGYFIHRADALFDFPIGNILLNLVKGHHQLNSGKFKVYVYYTFHSTPGTQAFTQLLTAQGAIVRDFTQLEIFEERFLAVRAALVADQMDIAVALMNSALEMALFASRCCPLQTYLNMAATHEWLYHKTDFMLHSGIDDIPVYARNHRLPPTYILPMICPLNRDEYLVNLQELKLMQVIAKHQQQPFIIGVHGRLEKVSNVFLTLIAKILKKFPQVTFKVGGAGDDQRIRVWAEQQGVSAQVIIDARYVQYREFLAHVAVFVNTFPHCGGNSSLEAMSLGIPVISMQLAMDGGGLNEWRDSNLIATNEQNYISLVEQCIMDKNFYYASSLRGIENILRQRDLRNSAAHNEEVLLNALRARSENRTVANCE